MISLTQWQNIKNQNSHKIDKKKENANSSQEVDTEEEEEEVAEGIIIMKTKRKENINQRKITKENNKGEKKMTKGITDEVDKKEIKKIR